MKRILSGFTILALKGPKNFAEGEAFLKIIWPFSQNG